MERRTSKVCALLTNAVGYSTSILHHFVTVLIMDNELQTRINKGFDGYYYLDTRIGHYGKFKSNSRHISQADAEKRADELVAKHLKEIENAALDD